MHERARLIGGSLLVRSELSGGSTVEVRTPLVAPGVTGVSETSERTTMVRELEAEADATQLELPESLVPDAGPGSSATLRGTAGGRDVNARGVQP